MGRNYPAVTVIVPAYNHQDYVEDCVLSVLEQDYPNIDLVVINDGSTDSTDERVRGLVKKNIRAFRYISKGNEGVVKTLNSGLRLSGGKYFCEVASDDMLLPGSIRKRADYLEKNPQADAVFCDAYLMEGSTKTGELLFGSNKKSGYRSSEHTIKDLLEGSARIFFASGMIKRSAIDRVGAFDEDFRYYEDFFKYRLVLDCKVDYLDCPVMYYRVHSTNTSRQNPLWVREEKILMLEKLLSGGESGKNLIKRHLFREYLKYLRVGMESGVERQRLLEESKKAIGIRPYSLSALYLYLSLTLRKGAV